jgi:hypothetical protein
MPGTGNMHDEVIAPGSGQNKKVLSNQTKPKPKPFIGEFMWKGYRNSQRSS